MRSQGLIAGSVAVVRHRPGAYPPPRSFGTTVVPGPTGAQLTVRVRGALLPIRGRRFRSGNSTWRIFPVRVRWAPPGRLPRIPPLRGQKVSPLRPRWPMRAGEFAATEFVSIMDGIWLYKGEVLASDGWLQSVLRLKVAPYGPEFSVTGCRGD
jgi:hypothetical protein